MAERKISIDEAIESLKDDLIDNPLIPGCRLEKAKRLGIEALKMIELLRTRGVSSTSTHLEGETEEELPTIDVFVGSDPNFTSDMTTEEYIRDMRGEKKQGKKKGV